MEKRFGALSSSVDPEKLSARVNGIILGLSSVIILVAARAFHIQLAPTDVVSLASQGGAVAGAIATIFGAIRWGITFIADKRRG